MRKRSGRLEAGYTGEAGSADRQAGEEGSGHRARLPDELRHARTLSETTWGESFTDFRKEGTVSGSCPLTGILKIRVDRGWIAWTRQDQSVLFATTW